LIAAEAYPIEEPFMLKISKLPLVKSFIHKALGKYVIRISLKRSYYNQDLITETVVDRYYAPFLTKNGKAVPIKLLQAMDFAELQAVARQYTSIQKKTLIIWGREDAISGVHLAYKLKADIRNAQLLVLPDSGHLVQEEQPARVNRAIWGFLRREWKGL
jgi:pimeloyl-ACP methyl ester carboxylesterase